MYAIKNISELYVIRLPQVILSKALVLQDECFGKNCLSFLDFTRNYERKSGIFVPWSCQNATFLEILCHSSYIYLLREKFQFSTKTAAEQAGLNLTVGNPQDRVSCIAAQLDDRAISFKYHQAFSFIVGPGHCSMISKYSPSLSKAVGPVDPPHLVVKKSHFDKNIHLTARLRTPQNRKYM